MGTRIAEEVEEDLLLRELRGVVLPAEEAVTEPRLLSQVFQSRMQVAEGQVPIPAGQEPEEPAEAEPGGLGLLTLHLLQVLTG